MNGKVCFTKSHVHADLVYTSRKRGDYSRQGEMNTETVTKEDLEQGRLSSVDQGMGKENGGLACHGVKCL